MARGFQRQGRRLLVLEQLEIRHLLASAPVAVADSYVVAEDTALVIASPSRTLVADGAVWKYLDRGSDLGTSWSDPAFDDRAWSEGPAQLGYGDGDEATVVGFGPDQNNKYPTTYFRHHFQLADRESLAGLNLDVLRDDGVAVYLNGVEVLRDNLPVNAGFFDYSLSTTQDEGTYYHYAIDGRSLVNGENVLAVEIHQASPNSSDISFDLRLTATEYGDGVLRNDSDADGDPITAILTGEPPLGSLQFQANGTFTYLPPANFYGVDTFAYVASDGQSNSDEATVTINVQPVNDPPFAEADAYFSVAGQTLEIPAGIGVLGNDVDSDGDSLTAHLVHGPSHGQLTLRADGSFTYLAPSGFTGSDTFTYTADDGTTPSLPATVTVNLDASNQPPEVMDDAYVVEENMVLDIRQPSPPAPIVIFSTDFSLGVPSEFSGVATVASVGRLEGLGEDDYRFENDLLFNESNPVANGDPASPTVLTLTNLPPHDRVDVDFLLAVINGWDGTTGFFNAPDIFNVRIDGQLVFSESFDTGNDNDQSYMAPANGQLAQNRDLGFGGGNDAAYDMSRERTLHDIPHTGDTLTVEWLASGAGYRRQGFQGRENEAFGIDNVRIVLSRGGMAEVESQVLVDTGATWRYLDDGSDQQTAWRDLGFDDTGWPEGPSQLGYGDGDEATVVGYGPDADNKFPTTYFRHTFSVDNPTSVAELSIDLLRDDGAAVYLNGTEIVRDNVPVGAQYNDFSLNTTQNENAYFTFTVDPRLLVSGNNVLAAEVHQASGNSSDISFNLRMTAAVEHAPEFNEFGVLDNDGDPEGSALLAVLRDGPAHGALSLAANGTFTYTPNPHYHGPDQFSYVASDAIDTSPAATVVITVTPGPNEPAQVEDKAYELNEDSVLLVPSHQGLLVGAVDTDMDPLQARIHQAPARGTVRVQSDGSFVYTPGADFFGADSFQYVAFDGTADSQPATVTLNVRGRPDSPRAADDQYFIPPGGSIHVDAGSGVLANDRDPDGDALTADLVAPPSQGTFVLRDDGSFDYVPATGFHDTIRFSYRAFDSAGPSNVATVSLTVDAAPVANDDHYGLSEDGVLIVSVSQGVLANDSDAEGDRLTATVLDGPANGQLTLPPTGAFTYTPRRDFFGVDTFTYRANDGDQDSAAATVTIAVSAVNDRPVARVDAYEVVENSQLVVAGSDGLLSNDRDVDGPALAVQLADGGGPQHGQLTLNADGSFVYEPELDFTGVDIFRYVATDTVASSDVTDVEIAVTPASELIVINEIMYHPSSENDAEEYIELYNTGLGTVDLTGWQFTRGIEFTLPEVTLGGGQFLVVAADVATFRAKYPEVTVAVVGGWQGRLSNRSEEIELVDEDGARVDRVTYADEGDWALRRRGPLDAGSRGWVWQADHDGLGSSAELINPLVSNRNGQNWAASTVREGTPGAANTVSSVSTAPMIVDVVHQPAVPRSTDTVSVTARLVDEDESTLAATLFYRIADFSPGPFTNLTMADDGQHGDGDPGDGVFGAELPRQSNRTVVEFYVQAIDQDGNSRTWPGPTDAQGAQEANLLYQVDDEAYDGDQPIYRLVLTPLENRELQNINRQSDAQMNATLVNVDGVGTDVRYNAGVRIRGNGTRRRDVPNYRVNLPSDRPWQGIDAVNLNTQYTHSQLVGMTLFELSRLPSEDATIVQVRRNGENLAVETRQYGSYARLEVTDSAFADNHFPQDPAGNIYRGVNGRLEYMGESANSYRGGYVKLTNAAEDNWNDLIALTRALDRNQTPDPEFMETIEQIADVDQWMRFLAVNALLVNEENGLINGRGDDYTLYSGIDDPRFFLLPHDLDTVLGEGDSPASTTRDLFEPRESPQLSRLLDVPEYLELYYFHLRDLSQTVFSAEQLNPALDNLLSGFVPQATIDRMKTFAAERVAYVLSQIPEASAPPVAWISGQPPRVTPLRDATLVVNGRDLTHYRFRLNDGEYGPEIPISEPIRLTDLADGTYSVHVVGRSASGRWQDPREETTSAAWTVDTQYSSLRINEVLAENVSSAHQGTFPDMIELVNVGDTPIQLAGMSLTDDPGEPDRYVFPNGTVIDPQQYLVLYANDADGTTGIHVGFSLDNDGEGVYLYDRPTSGGRQLDSVEFGIQLPDFSIGRNRDFQWELGPPTLGSENRAQPVGPVEALVINEWLADGERLFKDDLLEIFNRAPLPVDMGGLWLTDNPVGYPDRHVIAPLSFIAGQGFQIFVADSDPRRADHVNFRLDPHHESIGLFDTNGKRLDMVLVSSQSTDVSQGRRTDGDPIYEAFPAPTFGLSNSAASALPDVVELLDSLRVTEVMYNPIGSDTTEFIEFQNVGPSAIQLAGVRVNNGIDFTFGRLVLQPGQSTVIVNNRAAFEDRYGPGINIAGEFTAGMLDNGGERITVALPSPFSTEIVTFRYDDKDEEGWYSQTDGQGRSLQIVDPLAPPMRWDEPAAWQPSDMLGGSPAGRVVLPGDANYDGQFNSLDIVGVLISAKYNTGLPARWSEGDWNGDGVFDSQDIILSLLTSSYGQGPYAAVHAPVLPSPTAPAATSWEGTASDQDGNPEATDVVFGDWSNALWPNHFP